MTIAFIRKAWYVNLALIFMLLCEARSQTRTFEFLHGSSDEILSSAFDRDSSLLFTLDKAGFVITWDVNNMYPIRKFYAVPSYVFDTSKSPYHVDRKMIKVTKARIWIYDASNGLQTVIIDSYDRVNGKYIPADETEQQKFKDEFVNESSPALYPNNLADMGKGKDSFSNYKLAYSNDEVSIYNAAGIRIKKLDNVEDLNLFGITAAFFVTEDVLLVAGKYTPMAADQYGSGDFGTKSALIKINWKTGIVSSNRSYDFELGALTRAKLEAAGDSVVILKNRMNLWGHQIKPSQLINNFHGRGSLTDYDRIDPNAPYLIQKGYSPKFEYYKLEEGQNNMVNFLSDSYPSGNFFKIQPFTNTDMALVSHQPDGTLGEILFYKHMSGFIPIKFHSKQKLILWKGPSPSSTFIVSDFEGRELKRFTMSISDNDLLTFSADGRWFTLARNSSEIEVYNTQNFERPIILKTGVDPKIYLRNQVQFDRLSKKLAYIIYNPANQSQFIVAASDLQTLKRDTLLKLDIPPDAWTLDADFNRAAFYYPVNFADTSIFSNKQRSEFALKNKFRNIYDPTLYIMDLKINDIERVIPVTKQNPVLSVAFLGDKLVTVQRDGLLHYYGVQIPESGVSQWVRGKDQAIITEGNYYSTPGLVDFMLLGNKGNNYPVAEQDVIFNAPHKVINKLDSTNTRAMELYRLAYEKRIKQYDQGARESSRNNIPVVSLSAGDWNDYTLKDSVLKLALDIKDPASVKKLLVRVNGFSVFGKQGYAVTGTQKNITLNIPLDSGYNEVRIQAIDKLNNYSLPINLEYQARYTRPRTTPKVWVLAAGVSRYADSTHNLRYAAKDAEDFVKVFAFKRDYKVEILTLTDSLVTAAKILNTLSASKLNKEDIMLVYLAGHGLLDDKGDFYFAGHDMDFKAPEKRGLSYTNMMNTLEAIPARRKVLFLDACNSGFVDRSVYTGENVAAPSGGPVAIKNARGNVVINKPATRIPDKDVFMFMQKTFSDFSQDNNINILSAALGNSYALETSELRNGLFTYSIIRGLGLAKASTQDGYSDRKYGENSVISIRQLANYLDHEVKRISTGAQTPSFSLSRNASRIVFSEALVNAEMEISGYKSFDKPNELSRGEKYKLFLDRYKD